MNVLDALLRPIADIANRQIAMSTRGRELCAELEGKVVAVRLNDTPLSLWFAVEASGIRALSAYDGEPDVVIGGSVVTLAKLAGRSGEAAVRDGSLSLEGDAAVARSFQQLLQYGRPDLEEELSGVVGDSVAHGLGSFARSIGEWGRQARTTFRRNLSEYLQEESRAVPSRHEAEAFRSEVETLRDDVERLEARLKRLESESTPPHLDDAGR